MYIVRISITEVPGYGWDQNLSIMFLIMWYIWEMDTIEINKSCISLEEGRNKMILDNNYEMKVVIVENKNGVPRDIYDDFRKFKSEHPYSSYKFGFCIVSKEGNYIPEGCNDWNDSPEEALHDYFDNAWRQ